MPTDDTQIWMALKSGIDTLSMGAPAWPIAWAGKDFAPVSGKPFVAVGNVQAPPFQFGVEFARRSGTLLVSAVMPIGQDSAVYAEYTGKIVSHFQGCLRYNGMTMQLRAPSGSTAYPTGGFRDGGWWREPVLIPWQVFL